MSTRDSHMLAEVIRCYFGTKCDNMGRLVKDDAGERVIITDQHLFKGPIEKEKVWSPEKNADRIDDIDLRLGTAWSLSKFSKNGEQQISGATSIAINAKTNRLFVLREVDEGSDEYEHFCGGEDGGGYSDDSSGVLRRACGVGPQPKLFFVSVRAFETGTSFLKTDTTVCLSRPTIRVADVIIVVDVTRPRPTESSVVVIEDVDSLYGMPIRLRFDVHGNASFDKMNYVEGRMSVDPSGHK